MNTDEILKQSTAIKKEIGIDESVDFLVRSAENFSYSDENLLRILKKLNSYFEDATETGKQYAINYYEEMISTIEVRPTKINDELFLRYSDILYETNQIDRAEQYNRASIFSLDAKNGSSLLKSVEIYYKRALIIIESNKHDQKKFNDYLYFILSSKLYEISWQLYVDTKQNIDRFSTGFNKFKKFEIYNNIKDGSFDEESEYPFEDESEIQILKLLNQKIDVYNISQKFQHLVFIDFVESLGYNQNYFSDRFNDNNEFVKNITLFNGYNIPYDFLEALPSKMSILIDKSINEFLQKIISVEKI